MDLCLSCFAWNFTMSMVSLVIYTDNVPFCNLHASLIFKIHLICLTIYNVENNIEKMYI